MNLASAAVGIWFAVSHVLAVAIGSLHPNDRPGGMGADYPTVLMSHGESSTYNLGQHDDALDRDKRALQLEGLYDFDNNAIFSVHHNHIISSGKARHRGSKKGQQLQSNNQNKWSRSKMLSRAVEDIVVNSERQDLPYLSASP